jgi:hypothetical protein
MPRDDRDQNFEKALARNLGPSGAAPGAAESPADDCLDAETLAAYHERLLDPEETAQRKAHIAGCERCQEVLAQLEATDRIAVEADRDLLFDQMLVEIPELESAGAVDVSPVSTEVPIEVAAATPATEIAPLEEPAPAELEPAVASDSEIEVEPESEFILDPKLLHDPELVPTSAPPQSTPKPSLDFVRPAAPVSVVAKAAPTSATITFHSPREGRPKMVRFVAIAGALAAGLILWFVYRDQTRPTEIAQNRQPDKLELPLQARGAAPLPSADNKDAAATPQTSTPNSPAPQNAITPSAVPAQSALSKTPTDNVSNSLDDAQKTLDTAKAIEKKSRKDAAAATQSSAFIPSGQDGSAPAAGALDFARGAIARPGSTAAQRKLQPANQPSISAPLRTGDNTAGAAAARTPSGIPVTPPPARTKMNPGVVTEPSTVASAPVAAGQLSASAPSEALSKPINGRMVAALTPLSVPAPSGTTIWRIGQAGVIQRSTDSGATWSIQPSGVVTDLIAGSAYSDQICWLVGRNGTVLRTTNGGATWRKLASPSNVDLLAVFSINADSATVTDAAGRAFETTSAGAHWTRTKLQQ